jgi:soluble lytic murein transglycosylase
MPDTIDWAVEEIPLKGFSYADINDPETNIELGCWVLSFLSRQFEDNEELVIASYNAGIGNVKKWLGDTKYSKDGEYLHYIPYKETADYVKRVKLYDRIYTVLLSTSFFDQGIINETTDDN